MPFCPTGRGISFLVETTQVTMPMLLHIAHGGMRIVFFFNSQSG